MRRFAPCVWEAARIESKTVKELLTEPRAAYKARVLCWHLIAEVFEPRRIAVQEITDFFGLSHNTVPAALKREPKPDFDPKLIKHLRLVCGVTGEQS